MNKLRKECASRGLSQKGNKKTLQNRLRRALAEELKAKQATHHFFF